MMLLNLRFSSLVFSCLLCLAIDTWQNTNVVWAETFYVSVRGDDENPGTKSEPWRTVSNSALRLTAGDRLLIEPGSYRDEGQVLVRAVDPETYDYLPLEGSETAETYIGPATSQRPTIYGSFDIRGSHIVVAGLTVLGDQTQTDAGFNVLESHNITIRDCAVAYHGGGGIQFVHCDLVKAIENRVFYNATTNPEQHSGISSYQPIVRTDGDEQYGVIIARNVCYQNRNIVPNSNGDVTDGSGITIDDHFYAQVNSTIADAIAGTADPGESSGDPRIELDVEGSPLPYGRRTVVSDNHCTKNGARGIHVYLSDDVLLLRNFCWANFESQALLDTLPRDEGGTPYFVFGEITMSDSTRIYAIRNIALADKDESAGGAELFFDLQGTASTNRWRYNTFRNYSLDGSLISVANSQTSELLPLAGP